MLKGALIGIGIALIGALPPILHFITGPHFLGSIIGGFVGGSSVRATPERALGIGALMALLGILPMILFFVVLHLFFHYNLLDYIGVLLLLGMIGMIWIGTLGTLGALLGGYVSRKATGDTHLSRPPSS